MTSQAHDIKIYKSVERACERITNRRPTDDLAKYPLAVGFGWSPLKTLKPLRYVPPRIAAALHMTEAVNDV